MVKLALGVAQFHNVRINASVCLKRERVPVYIRNTYKVSIITYYRRGASNVNEKERKKCRSTGVIYRPCDLCDPGLR